MADGEIAESALANLFYKTYSTKSWSWVFPLQQGAQGLSTDGNLKTPLVS